MWPSSIEGFRGDDSQIRTFIFSTARDVKTRCYRQTSRMEFSGDVARNVIDAEELPLQRTHFKQLLLLCIISVPFGTN